MKSAIVIGAGIMGLSAAWAFARAGVAVRVIERDSVPNPRGSSVDDHRLIRHAYGAAAGYMRMVDAAYDAWNLLFREAGERPYVDTGVLAVASSRGGWLADSRAALLADGRAVDDLDAGAVGARYPFLAPDGIADAFRLAPGGVLLARRIVAMLGGLLTARGVGFDQAHATSLDPTRATVSLADGATRTADVLIVAAGPWTTRLLPPLAARVRATRQILVRLEPPPEHAAAWARAPMLLDLAEDGGFYAVPPVAGTPLKIGDHTFAETTDPDGPRAATPAETAEILDLARHRIRDLERYRVLNASACWYDVEPKERFIVEAIAPRAFVMSGFSGHGFKFGPVLGLALAQAVGDAAMHGALAAWAAGTASPAPGLLDALAQEHAA
jgi:sarcosine oxidase subunit beta